MPLICRDPNNGKANPGKGTAYHFGKGELVTATGRQLSELTEQFYRKDTMIESVLFTNTAKWIDMLVLTATVITIDASTNSRVGHQYRYLSNGWKYWQTIPV